MNIIKQILCAMAGAWMLTSAFAETYYQTSPDDSNNAPTYGKSSVYDIARWNTEYNGSGNTPTSPPNTAIGPEVHNYYITDRLLRTRLNSDDNNIFYADSLTVNYLNADSKIFFKGQADTTLTFTGSLILNDGVALDQNTGSSGSTNGLTQTLIATAIQVNGTVTIRQSQGLNGNVDQQTNKMVIDAPFTGGGTLLITNAIINTSFHLTLQGDNHDYTGNVTINNTNPTTATLARATTLIIEAGSNLGTGIITLGKGSTLTLNYADALALNSGLVIGDTISKINLTSNATYLQSYKMLDGEVYDLTNALNQTIGSASLGANIVDERITGGLFIIAAIPEPSTWLLLSVGTGLLIFLRRRK
ncbi:MAG: PEP-CTERM sorting domain-containing protein [Verrucomicrobiales bacterium]|nr:PEP-CTERM sorting domain-containing protein [Verrucomicrobiales bacterium]